MVDAAGVAADGRYKRGLRPEEIDLLRSRGINAVGVQRNGWELSGKQKATPLLHLRSPLLVPLLVPVLLLVPAEARLPNPTGTRQSCMAAARIPVRWEKAL